MKFHSIRIDGAHEDLSVERVQSLLEANYRKEYVDYILKQGKAFRLGTPTRLIWTEDEDGSSPDPDFYGVID